MKPGDRQIINAEIQMVQETIDGSGRFVEYVQQNVDEIDTGLQSSANRVIAEPSAMADAREAGAQDDDRTLGLMEMIRKFMNREVIPRVTGLKAGLVEFKWGAKDSFDLEFPTPIKEALNHQILTPEKAIIILEDNYGWKIPTDEDVMERFGFDPREMPPEDNTDDNNDNNNNRNRHQTRSLRLNRKRRKKIII